jgi:phosphonate degradation associated HDIG domain protein
LNGLNELADSETREEVLHLFQVRGSEWYGGEEVSQLEHALQAALAAERESASPQMIVAALLHDVGHLLNKLPEDATEQGIDDKHEILALKWLNKRFGPGVSQPVSLHVAAKRYLCAVDAGYASQLSPNSQKSLQLQGGPMSSDEVTEFESRPFYTDAVRLRHWDDRAKVVAMITPPLEHFAEYIGSDCEPAT